MICLRQSCAFTSRETVFAEKFEAIVSLGMANSRMKDYFDLLALARENAMDATQLGAAISATFARRGTAVPNGLPIGLTESFANDPAKQKQWLAFLRKSRLQAPPFAELVAELAGFSQTALTCAASTRGPQDPCLPSHT